MRIVSSVATVLVLAAASSAPLHAADHYRDTNGGSACHPANGAAAAKFTRANHYLTNNNATEQYVVCHFPMDDAAGLVAEMDYLSVHVQATGAGAVTCVAQTGSYFGGVLTLRANVARSHTFSAAGPMVLTWDGVLPRLAVHDVLTVNCKLAPGMRIGLIERKDAFP